MLLELRFERQRLADIELRIRQSEARMVRMQFLVDAARRENLPTGERMAVLDAARNGLAALHGLREVVRDSIARYEHCVRSPDGTQDDPP